MIQATARSLATIRGIVSLGLVLPLLGGHVAPRADVQGTIQATVDGRRMTWYSVSGESGGRPYSSSSWREMPGGVRMLGVGGFSTEEPPLESFEWNASGMPASYGTYDGSVIAIAIQLPADGTSLTATFPDAGALTSVSYQPTATLEDVMASTFMVSEGVLSVSNVVISGGLAGAQGTSSGTFQTLAGGRSVEITDGIFDVEGIPSFETIRR